MNDSPMNFIILPLTILFIVIVVRFILPIIRNRISGLMTWKRSFIIAGLYLGVLILMVPTLYMLPDNGFTKLMEDTSEAETKSQNSYADLKNHLSLVGDLDQQNGLYKNSHQTFKVDTKKLALIVDERMIGNYQIFVEPKGVDDGEIEVFTYVATQPQLGGGLDLTKLLSSPAISFQKDTLSVMSPSRQTVDFTQFNADFTVDQFKKQNSGGVSANFGENFIYIRVPKSLKLDQGKYSDQIQMLNSR